MKKHLLLSSTIALLLLFCFRSSGQSYRPSPQSTIVEKVSTSDFEYDEEHSGLISVSYGTPAAFNLNIMYFYERLGFQFSTSGIYIFALLLDEMTCSDAGTQLAVDFPFMGQLNATVKIFSAEDRFLSLGIMGGTSITRPKPLWMNVTNRYFYFGPSIHYVYKHFFTEVGYAFARDVVNDVSFRMPTYQVGLLLHF